MVYTYYGSFSRACVTMLEITIAPGTWGKCGRLILEAVSWNYALFYLGYLMLISFGLIRVVSAVFLKESLAAAARDQDAVTAATNQDPEYTHNLYRIFTELDQENQGYVTLEQLNKVARDAEAMHWLHTLEIHPHEMKGMFTLIDDGDDQISFCEFVAGIMRLKDPSKGVDIPTFMYENKKLLKRVLKVADAVERVEQAVHNMIDKAD